MKKLEKIEVGCCDDIPILGSRVVKTAEGEIAIFRTADQHFFAVKNSCPHRHGPLSEGLVHNGKVTCPLHNWVIDLESGEAMGADVGCTPTYQVIVEGETLFLMN